MPSFVNSQPIHQQEELLKLLHSTAKEKPFLEISELTINTLTGGAEQIKTYQLNFSWKEGEATNSVKVCVKTPDEEKIRQMLFTRADPSSQNDKLYVNLHMLLENSDAGDSFSTRVVTRLSRKVGIFASHLSGRLFGYHELSKADFKEIFKITEAVTPSNLPTCLVINNHTYERSGSVKMVAGHGGILRFHEVNALDSEPSRDSHLILKPIQADDQESTNFQTISKSSLKDAFVGYHGTQTYNDKTYLVLDDLGESVVDIKLAAPRKDGKPVTYNEEELLLKKRRKGQLTKMMMRFSEEHSPGYMIAQGPRFLRPFLYRYSTELLHKKLDKFETSDLFALKTRLAEIRNLIDNEKTLALIGASVLITTKGGALTANLIDPSHLLDNATYEDDEVSAQRTSNLESLDFLIKSLDELIKKKEDELIKKKESES